MHFLADQKKIQECLNVVEKAIPNKTPMDILKGIYVEAKDGIVNFVANNLEMGIRAECSDVHVMEEGVLVLPNRLADIIRQFPEGKIEFKTDKEGSRAEIFSSDINFFLYGMNAEEFPVISTEDLWGQWTKLVFQANEFKSILKKILFAASQDESKPMFRGVLLEVDDEQNISCMASDTYRLAQHKKNIATDNNSEMQPIRMLIPAKTLAEIFRILDDSDKEIECYCWENEIVFRYKQFIFSGRLLEDRFPDFNNAFPAEFETKIVVNTELLEKTIGRAALLAEGQNLMISLRVKENILQISSGSEIGIMKEELTLEKNEGHDLEEIYLNCKYLLDPLRVMEDEFIELEFNGSSGPCILKCRPKDENIHDDYRYLVLPIKIDRSEY